MIMQAARRVRTKEELCTFFTFFFLLLSALVSSHLERKQDELLCHVGFHRQGVHEEYPTYPVSDIGISPRSKQSLHSCNIIFQCSLRESVFTVL